MAEEDETAVGVGLFLGARGAAVALVAAGGRAQVLADARGRRCTPSCVAWGAHGAELVGCSRQERARFDPASVFFDVHLLLARAFDDREVQRLAARAPFDIVDIDGKPHVAVTTAQGECQAMSPEQVLALVVARQKQIAEDAIGREVRDVVVAMPMALNDAQREAVKAVGRDAGLNVLRVVSGATSACIGFNDAFVPHSDGKEHLLAVLALDRDYATVTAINFEDGVFEVIGTRNMEPEDTKSSPIDQSLEAMATILQENGKQWQDVEDLYLVGDWSDESSVSASIHNYIDNPAARIHVEAPANFEAARGAAMVAWEMKKPTQYVEPMCMLNFYLLSMGVETAGGIMTTIVRRGTTIPNVKSRIFTPLHEHQHTVIIKIFEGERIWVPFNRCLGQVELHNLRRRQDNRLPQVKVTFDMDVNDNMVVCAEELDTDNRVTLHIPEIERRQSMAAVEEILRQRDEHSERDSTVRNSLSLCASMDEYLARLNAYASRVTEEFGIVPAFSALHMQGGLALDEDEWIRLDAASTSSTFLDDHVVGASAAAATADSSLDFSDMAMDSNCVCS